MVDPNKMMEDRGAVLEVVPANPTNNSTAPHDIAPPKFTDEDLALRFAKQYESKLRYVHKWGKWFCWNGTTWLEDSTLLGFNYAREICRAASAECEKNSTQARNVASAKTVAAVERLAKADRIIAGTVDQWDADPWLLNTPKGIVDLRTGKISEHDHRLYQSKTAAVGPGGNCPLWQKFLDRITDKDQELKKFIQRVIGYSLSGDTSEHALFFFFGTGANGKSVVIDTIASILGSYQRTAPIETFTASNRDSHPTELASLQGARLVTATETEEGRRWAESKIKALTGGDEISARFMRQDFFEFKPNFKLLIAGNHKPGLRSVDEAIRRRFHLIPFKVTIPAGERDPDLKKKLEAEWEGILEWAIEGCLAWQKNGLCPPPSVVQATEAYLDAEDGVSTWISECCSLEIDAWSSSSDLRLSWESWAETNGEPKGSAKRFAQNLEARGFTPNRRRNNGSQVRGFDGIYLNNNLSNNTNSYGNHRR